MPARVPFAVKRNGEALPRYRWQVMRVGDFTVISRHARRRDAVWAAACLVRDGADPGPVLTVSELEAAGRLPRAESRGILPAPRIHGAACDTALFGGDDSRPIGGCDCIACDAARELI